MKFFWILPLSPADLWRAVLSSLVLSFVLTYAVARYWHFYHLHTPGSGGALLFIVLPILALSGSLVSLTVTIQARRRYRSPLLAAWSGPVLSCVIFIALFALELSRTAEMRSGEGIGAGELGPFFRTLLPSR
jgi:hypothetical protein